MNNFTMTRRQALAGAVLATTSVASAALAAGTQPGMARRKLRVGLSSAPPGLEPAIFQATNTQRITPQMFDTLVMVDHANNLALRPGLAERWERIDSRSVRLFLRKGVVFHDGSPFTSDDVVFSLGPTHLFGPGSFAKQVFDTLDRVEAVDPYTVIVYSKDNDALIERRLASWSAEIVSRKAFDAAGSWDKWKAAPVGSGPYKLVESKLDVRVLLAAHDGYWGGGRPSRASTTGSFRSCRAASMA